MKTKRLLFLFVICTLVLASCASARSAATPMPAVKGMVSSAPSSVQNEALAPAAPQAAMDSSYASTGSGGSKRRRRNFHRSNGGEECLAQHPRR